MKMRGKRVFSIVLCACLLANTMLVNAAADEVENYPDSAVVAEAPAEPSADSTQVADEAPAVGEQQGEEIGEETPAPIETPTQPEVGNDENPGDEIDDINEILGDQGTEILPAADYNEGDIEDPFGDSDGDEDTIPEDAVASMNGKYYSSLQEAIIAAGNTATTIQLIEGAAGSIIISEGQDITINAGIYAINGDGSKYTIQNSGALTINGNGGSITNPSTATDAATVFGKGTFYLNGVVVNAPAAGGFAIYYRGGSNTLKITDSVVNGGAKKSAIYADSGNIEMDGCTVSSTTSGFSITGSNTSLTINSTEINVAGVALTVAAGSTATLSGSENKITTTGTSKTRIIDIKTGGKVTVKDGVSISSTAVYSVYVAEGCTLNVEGGNIDNQSGTPIYAFGEVSVSGGTIYAKAKQAINALVGADVTVSGGEISSANKNTVSVSNGAKLTVKGGAIKNASNTFGAATITASGKIDIQEGTIEATNRSAVEALTGADVTVSGGKISTDGVVSTVSVSSGAKLTVTGGTVTYSGDSYGAAAIKAYGIISISGGTIEGNERTAVDALKDAEALEGADVTISGGDISSAFGNTVSVNSGAQLAVTGGTITNTAAKGKTIDASGYIDISGGTIIATGSEDESTSFGIYINPDATAKFSGKPTITATYGYAVQSRATSEENVIIDETFIGSVDGAVTAFNGTYKNNSTESNNLIVYVETNAGDYKQRKYFGQIGVARGTFFYYRTLADAIKHIADNNPDVKTMISLDVKNVFDNSDIVIPNNSYVGINFNNYEYTGSITIPQGSIATLKAANITGTVINSGTVNIADGYYKMFKATDGSNNITGGHFEAGGYVDSNYTYKTITNNETMEYSAEEQSDGSFIVTEGATFATVNGKGYKSLGLALKAAKDGDTVILRKDCNGDTGFAFTDESTKKITLDLNGKTITAKATEGENKGNSNAFSAGKGLDITIMNGTIEVMETKHFALVVKDGSKATLQNVVIRAVEGSEADTSGFTAIFARGGEVFLDDCTISENGKISIDNVKDGESFKYNFHRHDVDGKLVSIHAIEKVVSEITWNGLSAEATIVCDVCKVTQNTMVVVEVNTDTEGNLVARVKDAATNEYFDTTNVETAKKHIAEFKMTATQDDRGENGHYIKISHERNVTINEDDNFVIARQGVLFGTNEAQFGTPENADANLQINYDADTNKATAKSYVTHGTTANTSGQGIVSANIKATGHEGDNVYTRAYVVLKDKEDDSKVLIMYSPVNSVTYSSLN